MIQPKIINQLNIVTSMMLYPYLTYQLYEMLNNKSIIIVQYKIRKNEIINLNIIRNSL